MAERKRMTEAVSSLFESAFRGAFTRRCLGAEAARDAAPGAGLRSGGLRRSGVEARPKRADAQANEFGDARDLHLGCQSLRSGTTKGRHSGRPFA